MKKRKAQNKMIKKEWKKVKPESSIIIEQYEQNNGWQIKVKYLLSEKRHKAFTTEVWDDEGGVGDWFDTDSLKKAKLKAIEFMKKY